MIRYTSDLSQVSSDQLTGFFVDWTNPPSPTTHLHLLRNSDYVVLAIDAEPPRVVGFVTAISDGVLSAYIPLLEVLPEYQGQGIGSELVSRMCALLEHLYMVDILCDADSAPFYERLGFRRGVGMSIRHYGNQAGAPSPD